MLISFVKGGDLVFLRHKSGPFLISFPSTTATYHLPDENKKSEEGAKDYMGISQLFILY